MTGMEACGKSERWLHFIRSVPTESVEFRFFLIPPAGGDTAVFYGWEKWLPRNVEVGLLRIPGRGMRIEEPLISDCRELARQVAEVISEYVDLPYAFFGHSMGALIAYETTACLLEMKRRLPERLFISSLKAPGDMSKLTDDETGGVPLYLLGNDDLKQKIIQFGGIPDEIQKNDAFFDVILPTFRNDLKLCETYTLKSRVRLPVPFDVFGGHSDQLVTRGDLEQWKDYSDRKVTITIFPGGHFYFEYAQNAFMFTLSQRIENLLDAAARA